MTESNTSGSTRNVIDAFVSAQENKQVAQDGAAQSGVVQNGVVQNGAVSQEAAPQVEPKQNVATPNGTTQPAIVDKKTVQKRKNIWKALISVIAVAVVGVVVAIVVISLPSGPREISDEEKEMREEMEKSSKLIDKTYEIKEKMKTEPNYTLIDAEHDYEELISNSADNEKIEVTISYAFFILEQSGDIEKASDIMRNIDDKVANDLRSRYYIAFGNLYKRVQDEEKAYEYYKMASEWEERRNDL